MTESTPVAATVHEIRTAYPKAKSDFILDCITKSMPMASVASAAAEEMMKENDDLKKQVAALQDDMAKAKAKAEADPAEPDDDDKADAKAKAEADPAEPDEDDKADAKAKARAKGVKPIAKGTSGRPSALIRWNEAIVIAQKSFPKDKMKAVALANRNNPGLREAFILEVNAR